MLSEFDGPVIRLQFAPKVRQHMAVFFDLNKIRKNRTEPDHVVT